MSLRRDVLICHLPVLFSEWCKIYLERQNVPLVVLRTKKFPDQCQSASEHAKGSRSGWPAGWPDGCVVGIVLGYMSRNVTVEYEVLCRNQASRTPGPRQKSSAEPASSRVIRSGAVCSGSGSSDVWLSPCAAPIFFCRFIVVLSLFSKAGCISRAGVDGHTKEILRPLKSGRLFEKEYVLVLSQLDEAG